MKIKFVKDYKRKFKTGDVVEIIKPRNAEYFISNQFAQAVREQAVREAPQPAPAIKTAMVEPEAETALAPRQRRQYNRADRET